MCNPPSSDVDFWSVDIDAVPLDMSLLSADECRRAERFRNDAARRRFLAGRQALRRVLADYLETEPVRVALTTDRNGKPCINSRPDLSFNMAHSGDRIALAVTVGAPLGVDIELIAPSIHDETVARFCFSNEECKDLASLPCAVRAAAFFQVWTRKEAVAKALGGVSAMPFDRFAVSVLPNELPRLVRITGDDPRHWSLVDLLPKAGYSAALAVRSSSVVVRHRTDLGSEG